MASRFFEGFRHAGRGLKYLLKEEPHFRFEAIVAILLLLALIAVPLTYTEASFIILAIVLVLGFEAVNTVIERMMDSITTERKRWIANIKDMMASVVLINSIGGLCIGAITLMHYYMRITGMMYTGNVDTMILNWLNSFAGHTALGNSLIVFFASTSALILIFVFVIAIGASRISLRQKMYRFVAGGAAAFIARYALTELIRFFHPRLRPFMADHMHQLITEQGSSFPSGHAAFFFALSAIMFSWDKRLGMFFFAASLVMGIARVASGVHYPSDIIGGMIVGIVSAWIIMRAMPVSKKKV